MGFMTSFRPSYATLGLVLMASLMTLYITSGNLYSASEKAIKHEVPGSNDNSRLPSPQRTTVTTTNSLNGENTTSIKAPLTTSDNEAVSSKMSKELNKDQANRMDAKQKINQPQSRGFSGSKPAKESMELGNELAEINTKGGSESNVMDSYKNVHIKRIEHINSVCNNYDITKNEAYKGTFQGTFMQSRTYNFTVCKVAKVGSTFFMQMLSILERGINQGARLFSIRRRQVHSSTNNQFKSSRRNAKTQRTILISRDPFSRLYSAFIDKFYLPIFVQMNYKIQVVPYNKTYFNGQCPGTISFNQFLDYTVKEAFKGSNFNYHWAPISAYCHPCEVKPFLLMKQESFVNDVEIVLDTLNVTTEKRNFISNTLHNNRVEITIPGYVQTLYDFAKNKYVVNCLGWENVAQRIWTSFQIQGYISQDIDFPSEKFDSVARLSDHQYLTTVILDYIKTKPLTSEERKQQRRMYLCKAYEDVPKRIIVGLQGIFKYDFLVYNYTNVPPCW